MTITRLASQVLASIPSDSGSNSPKQVDVVLVVAILKLILLAYECWQLYPASAVEQCRDPGLLARWKVRRIVKHAVADSGSGLSVQEVYAAVLGLGRSLTVGDVMACVEELKSEG